MTIIAAKKAVLGKIPQGAITVKTANSVYKFGKADENGERDVSRDETPLPYRCTITFLKEGAGMQFVLAGAEKKPPSSTSCVESITPG